MKRIASTLAMLILTIAMTHPLQSQWIHAEGNLPATWGVLDAIDATDSLTALVAVRVSSLGSQWPLYRTVNGGTTWTAIPIPTPFGAGDVAMTDANHLWYVNDEGRIYGTTNGGTTWTLQYYDTLKTQFINYIEMFNANDGVAMGDNLAGLVAKTPAFLRTTNGGATWTAVAPASLAGEYSGDMWRRMDFVNMSVGYFRGVKGSTFYKTTDGGTSWTALAASLPFGVVKFYNETLGLASRVSNDTTHHAEMWRTLDGGSTWQAFKVSDLILNYISDIEFVPGDASKVWCCSAKEMYFSADTGRTWTKQSFDVEPVIGRDIELVAGGYGWFGGDNHRLYKTSRATAVYNIQTGVGEQTQSIPASIELGQNYPNPFNPSTTIRYALPEAGYATVKIYSVLGREVATLAARHHAPGTHSVTWDASQMSAGMYFYELRSGSFSETKKLVLVK